MGVGKKRRHEEANTSSEGSQIRPEIQNCRLPWETNDQWELRSKFLVYLKVFSNLPELFEVRNSEILFQNYFKMARHWGDFDKFSLLAKSQCFINMTFMQCR